MTLEVIGLLFAGAILGVVMTVIFIVATYRDKALVPRHKGTPADLPPWAAERIARLEDEIRHYKDVVHTKQRKAAARKARP